MGKDSLDDKDVREIVKGKQMTHMEKEVIKEPNELLHKRCEAVTDFTEAKLIAHDLIVAINHFLLK